MSSPPMAGRNKERALTGDIPGEATTTPPTPALSHGALLLVGQITRDERMLLIWRNQTSTRTCYPPTG